MRRLGLDPRLGAQLGEAGDQPLGGLAARPRRPRGGRSAPVPPAALAAILVHRHRRGTVPAYHGDMLGGGSITLFHVRGIRIAVDWSWFLDPLLRDPTDVALYGDVLGRVGHRGHARSCSRCQRARLLRLDPPARARPRLRRRCATGSASPASSSGSSAGWRGWTAKPTAPGTEFEVALAGPLVTLAIVVVLSLGRRRRGRRRRRRSRDAAGARIAQRRRLRRRWRCSPGWPRSTPSVLVFNLLPAFPMDGGRVARAIAWWRTGDRNAATRFAANLGRVFGYLFIGGGLAADRRSATSSAASGWR